MLLKTLHFLRGIIGVEEETCENIASSETGKKLQVDMCQMGNCKDTIPQYHYGKWEERILQAAKVRSHKTLKRTDFPPRALTCCGILNSKLAATCPAESPQISCLPVLQFVCCILFGNFHTKTNLDLKSVSSFLSAPVASWTCFLRFPRSQVSVLTGTQRWVWKTHNPAKGQGRTSLVTTTPQFLQLKAAAERHPHSLQRFQMRSELNQ